MSRLWHLISILRNIISSKLFKQASRFLKLSEEKKRPRSTPSRKAKVGLALSSGGARGLAHIGVLQVLEEHGITVNAISGSSMGAYIGAHYARGVSPNEMKDIASHMKDRANLWKMADPIIPPVKGFLKGEKATEYLKECIGNPDFSDLNLPLYVTTFDLDTQEKLVINSGNVSQAVHASCAIPGVISPVKWSGHRCSDGGVVDPVPVSSLKEHEDLDLIIAVSLIPSLEDISQGLACKKANDDPESFHGKVVKSFNSNTNLFAKGNTVDTLRRCVRAAQSQIAHVSCAQADIVMRPHVYNLPWHAFSSFDDILEIGRQAALEQLPALKEKIALIEGREAPSPSERPSNKCGLSKTRIKRTHPIKAA